MAANFLSRRISVLHTFSKRTHVGYLPFEGRFPSNTTEKAINLQQIKAINLKPVKRMVFKCDPVHPKSASIRRLMTTISEEKIVKTGPKTTIKYDFVSDRSSPSMTLTLHDNDTTVIFKMAEMTEHEVIYEMNKIVLPLIKAEKESASKKEIGKKPGASGGGKKKK